MDNFDEFEFKPITEGLGFHKKTQKQKLDLSDTLTGKTLPQSPIKNKNSQFTKLGEETIELESPVAPRRQQITQQAEPSGYQSPYARPAANFQLEKTNFVEESKTQPINRENVSVALPAIFFDSIVVVGLTGLFLFATFLIAKVDPVTIVNRAPQDPMTMLGLTVLLFSVIQGYLLISRTFFGSTLGEWAFEIELGSRADQDAMAYPLRVLLRSLLTIATGMLLLPLLSLVLGRDIGGKLSGVSLFRG